MGYLFMKETKTKISDAEEKHLRTKGLRTKRLRTKRLRDKRCKGKNVQSEKTSYFKKRLKLKKKSYKKN